MQDENYPEKWAAFARGTWVKGVDGAPTVPGVYPVFGGQGHNSIRVRGEDNVPLDINDPDVCFLDRGGHNSFALKDWNGWWWTQPIPELPLPPNVERAGGGYWKI